MRLVEDAALIDKGRGLAGKQLVIAHKEVDADAQRGVVDDLAPALAGGVGGVLALPMEMGVDHPMVHVFVLVGFALLVERDQQDVRFLLRQNDMAHLYKVLFACRQDTASAMPAPTINEARQTKLLFFCHGIGKVQCEHISRKVITSVLLL